MATPAAVHDIPTLINQFLATADDDQLLTYKRYSDELSQLIMSDELSLLQFIQFLGPDLTSENDLVRSKAVHCLSETFQALNKAKLSKQDIQVLIQFLIAKFEDKICLIHILRSLSTIISFNNFKPSINDNYNQILSTLLEKYDPKKNFAKVRYEGFQILTALFDTNLNYIKATKASTDLFVKTFIHIASGEKDPRNLLISFKLNSSINENLEFDPADETNEEFLTDLFDVCFCYFPISFTPPANDPYKITADQLKTGLRTTIASQSLFAKDSFTSLFEKLTSTNPMIRNDVLKTLLLCIENYTPETILEYWVVIWNSLKFEILHNEASMFSSVSSHIIPESYDTELEDLDDNKALVLTLVILNKLCQIMNGLGEADKFLSTVTKELKSNLATVNDKTFKQSVIMLSVLSTESPETYNKILKFIFSYDVWGKFIRSDIDEDEQMKDDLEIDKNEDFVLNISKQRELIDNLGFFLIAYHSLTQSFPKFSETENELKLFKDNLLIFLGHLLQSSSNIEKTLKCKVIQQLFKLIALPDLLSNQEISLIFSWLNDTLKSNIKYDSRSWENDLVLNECINGLIKVMSQNNDEITTNNVVNLVIELILPTFLEYLDLFNDKGADLTNFNKTLVIINKLCVNYHFLETLTIRLLNKLSYFRDDSTITEENKVIIIKDIINGFITSFKKTQSIKQFLTNSWYKNFIPRFLKIILSLKYDSTIIELSSRFIGLIIRFIDKSKHQGILTDFVELFVLNKSHFDVTLNNIVEIASPQIGIFNGVLANVDKSTDIESSLNFGVYELIDKLSKFCFVSNEINESEEYSRLGYLQSITILVNKFTKQNDDKNSQILDKLFGVISQFNEAQTLSKKQIESFEIFVWELKALVLRNDKFGIEYIFKLLSLLASPNDSLSNLAAESFNVIMIDLPILSNETFVDESANENKPTQKGIISKVNNLNVRLLYKQRFFEIVLPELIKGYNSGTNKEVYLISLSIILSNIPNSILKLHLEEISPLILSALNINNTVILQASLTTFKIIISESPAIITPHLSSLIPKLLELVTSKKVIDKTLINNEQIRLLSLEALQGIFQNIGLQNIVPYQKQAIKQLTIALDDKRRNVRKLSSDVRQVLYELGR